MEAVVKINMINMITNQPKTRKLKAISPLVAVIMLIAFTLIVAGILAGWATQFAEQQRQEIETCTDASIFLQSGRYNPASQELTLVIYNNGEVNLDFITLLTYANLTLHPEGLERYNQTFSIPAATIKSFTYTGITSDLQESTIKSQKCPGTQDLLNRRDITGLGG